MPPSECLELMQVSSHFTFPQILLNQETGQAEITISQIALFPEI